MGYNSNLQSNNVELQVVLDLINELPEMENLDAELSTQDSLISQIQSTVDNLPDASSGGSGSGGTFTLQIVSEDRFACIDNVFYTSNGQPSRWQGDGLPITSITIENIDISTYVIIDGGLLIGGAQMFTTINMSANLEEFYNGIYCCREANAIATLEILE